MSKKISIKKRDSTWAVLSVQDNAGGTFWPAHDVELTKEEITALTFEEIMESIHGVSTTPKETQKSFIHLPMIMENKKKWLYVLSGIVIVLSFSIALILPKQTPQTLQEDIKQIRADREKTYDKCVAVCDSERSVFDARVNHKKAIINKIGE
jgi:hypothetical protein